MANDKDVAAATAINCKCSICGETYQSVQECLKHELIKHSLQKKNNRMQKRLNATTKFLNAEQKLSERIKLREQLKKCTAGTELHRIFEIFCMKTDSLDLIFTRIQTCMEKELRSEGIVRIYPFGSIGNGLALRDCDIDVFLDVSNLNVSPQHQRYKQEGDKDHQQRLTFNRINNLLHRSPHFTDVFAIRRARVPIIKCKHRDTGFSIDINISCPSSCKNTQFIYELVKSDGRIQELMLFLKIWAKNTLIIGRDNMTSYCLVTLIIFFLQQPWQTETEESSDSRILKSIKELQEHCPFHMLQGINYAYNLSQKHTKPQIPATVTTWDLIRRFYHFYANFNFEDLIISPFYGKSFEKTQLTPDIFDEYYKQLRTITQYWQGDKANDLQIDRCMCVQDAFCLNQNTAKNIVPRNKAYILLCLQNAQQICENRPQLTQADLYEQLLFETIRMKDKIADQNKEQIKSEVLTDLKNLKLPPTTTATNTTSNSRSISNKAKLLYTIIPTKADLRTLASHYPTLLNAEAILRCWCQHYIKATEIIMTKLYHMDMQKHVPTQQKHQKLDTEVKGKELNESWLISCSIDLWSNRCFQKSGQSTFMSYHLEQTRRLHNLRRQDANFSVTLNGILKMNPLPNYMGLEIQLELPEGVTLASLKKKSPFRKFFNVLQNTLQSCNFKSILSIEETNIQHDIEDDCTKDENNIKMVAATPSKATEV